MGISIGDIYKTNKYGKIKVINKKRKKWKNTKDRRTKYYITFLNTGCSKWCSSSQIYKGNLRDGCFDHRVGSILKNNFGIKFKILSFSYKNLKTRKENKTKFYKIKFLSTGNIVERSQSDVLDGRIKDKFYPSVYDVGYIGDNKLVAMNYKKEYSIWSDMIARCHQKKNKLYKYYGEKGVRVCERWHSFKNFLSDIKDIDGYKNWKNNHEKYQLDKDKKQRFIKYSKKIYSKNTCSFILKSTNISISSRRTYFIAENIKSGEEIYCDNQTKFAEEHGLYQPNINKCLNNKLNRTGEWRFKKISKQQYAKKMGDIIE